MLKKYFILTLIIFSFISCDANKEINYEDNVQIAMGTVCSIKVDEQVNKEVINNCFEILMDVEKELSRTNESSFISVLNRDKKVQVNKDVFNLFKYSLELARNSSGKFNIAMGSVVSLWDIGGENPRIPSDEELAKVNINYEEIKLDEDTLTIEIPKDMEVDLGGIGKGYAADKLVSYLKSEGIYNGIINLGGNVVVIGAKSEDLNWGIGIQHPDINDELFASLSVKDVSIVTSGTYERYFEEDGVRYHHILDPDTLYPSISDIKSSTIIGSNSMICDSLSTTCFLLGAEKSIALINSMQGYDAMFMLDDNSVIFSDNFSVDYKILID